MNISILIEINNLKNSVITEFEYGKNNRKKMEDQEEIPQFWNVITL